MPAVVLLVGLGYLEFGRLILEQAACLAAVLCSLEDIYISYPRYQPSTSLYFVSDIGSLAV